VIWRSACATSIDRSSPLAEWTTLGVGGPADAMAFPESVEACSALVAECAATSTPWRVLGRGSNLLVADEGVRGLVIHTERLRWIRFGEGGRVRAGAGTPTSDLLAQTRRRGLGGLACLVGYPATVGGAARMNAGGRWGETGAVVEEVVVVDADGEVRTLSAAECAFGYRHSALAGRVVVEVAFRLPEVDAAAYGASLRAIHAEKRRVQPLDQPSAGCVFRNPAPGVSAGRLVDECGLKGAAVGGAAVSDVHGNFVVNRGGATADDVLRLVDLVRAAVARRTGHELVLEVEVWRTGHVPAAS
jgi:UDP-N-acetylmuramate dehydrogenase